VNRDVGSWLAPLVAIGVLIASITQTVSALKVTGAFGWEPEPVAMTVPPAYASVNSALDRRDPGLAIASLHDPFTVRASPVAVRPVHHADPPPAPPPTPVLTAIVWDSDPRALVHWKDRDWTVREGALFDDFQVVSITRDQVSLRHGEATLVLQRRNPGD